MDAGNEEGLMDRVLDLARLVSLREKKRVEE
jgi:hypothetical protein